MSAHDTTPGQARSSFAFTRSTVPKPRKVRFGIASFSDGSPGTVLFRRTEPSHPCITHTTILLQHVVVVSEQSFGKHA
jgi:hypothetical protein